MAAQVGVRKEGLREGAVIWLDKNLEGKSFSQRFVDARGLLQIADRARNVLERQLPLISPDRPDVKKTYSQYRSAVSQLISDLEDSVSQMEKLRASFSKSEHKNQLPAYDAQLRSMKERLAGLKADEKWRPYELRGYKPEKVALLDEKGRVNAQIASLDLRGKSVPVKVRKGDEMVFTVAEVEESEKKKMPLPEVKPRKERGDEMVFTLNEVERGQDIAIAKFNVKEAEANLKKAREDGRPLAKFRMQRLDAYLQLNKLTGDPIPERVKIKRA